MPGIEQLSVKPSPSDHELNGNLFALTLTPKSGVSVRLATLDDLPGLVNLETFRWPASLSASEMTLRCRLEAHPAGQFVAIAPSGELLGAVYTQRVASCNSLLRTAHDAELDLHAAGGPVVHLLGAVQRPGAGVVDQLRRHVLHLLRLGATVERVCCVARCQDFDPSRHGTSQQAYRAYVAQGSDPSLLFHSAAGASIGELVPNYRPSDTQNLGYGVIVSYELSIADGQNHRALPTFALTPERPYSALHKAQVCLAKKPKSVCSFLQYCSAHFFDFPLRAVHHRSACTMARQH